MFWAVVNKDNVEDIKKWLEKIKGAALVPGSGERRSS
jgi:hypothetical protein